MSFFRVTRAETTRYNSVNWDNPGFGLYFSDHVFISNYKNGNWDDGEILPYAPMSYEPGFCTLHYGQTIFEGLKAFRTGENSANIFRPDMNAKRLNHSAERVCIPQFDNERFLLAIKELTQLDNRFIPNKRGHSLYIRPVMFGSSNFLGVHASDDYQLIIMTSPVSSYYPEGLAPIKILISSEYTRAVRGGLGSAKTAANYAASLLAGRKAKEQGFSQVLWLDAVSRDYIDEVGAMNIMFIINDELITPPLDQGTILAGVTRDSALRLARDWGMKVSERQISVDEVYEANSNGTLQEVFGTGTAAVISPVGLLSFRGNNIVINDMKIGPVSQKLYDTITGIQYSEIDDIYNWNMKVEF